MIFVTVGTQGQFNRLIRTVDEWAGLRGRTDVFAQTGLSDYRPKHICAKPFIDPTEFRERVESASACDSPCRHGLDHHGSGIGKTYNSHASPR